MTVYQGLLGDIFPAFDSYRLVISSRHQAQGICLYYRRLDQGHFVWPQISSGPVLLSADQLSLLLEGIDWRRAHRSGSPEVDPAPPTVAA